MHWRADGGLHGQLLDTGAGLLEIGIANVHARREPAVVPLLMEGNSVLSEHRAGCKVKRYPQLLHILIAY